MLTILTEELLVLNDDSVENIFQKQWELYQLTSPTPLTNIHRFWCRQTATSLINIFFSQVAVHIVETANLYSYADFKINFAELSKLSYECFDLVYNLHFDFEDYCHEGEIGEMAVAEENVGFMEDTIVGYSEMLIEFLYSNEMYHHLNLQFNSFMSRIMALKSHLNIIHFWYSWYLYESKVWESSAPLWGITEEDVFLRIPARSISHAESLDAEYDEYGFWTWTDVLGATRTSYDFDVKAVGDFDTARPFITIIKRDTIGGIQ
ncbi:MAG: hypothetical protein ACRDBQ_18100 [Shewanella sp.]